MRVEMALGATSWELQRGALEHEEVARGEQQQQQRGVFLSGHKPH